MTYGERIFASEHGAASKVFKWALAVALVSGTVAIVIPDKTDVATMVVGRYATNSAEVAKLPDNVVQTINEWLVEARPKVEPKK
jgi:hypothetical protein